MKPYLIALVLVLTLTRCSGDYLLQDTLTVKNGDWAYLDVQKFRVEVTDTLIPYNFYIHVRHGGKYAYQNLIVMVRTYFPNNTFVVDTIDCPLADNYGRWYGKGLGDILENEVLFKTNIQMPMAGPYTFEIQHAMRSDTVHEIYDLGLSIESAIN